LQAPACQRGEEGLDGVDPGARGRREVKGPARVAGEPGADLGVLVGGVVVENRIPSRLPQQATLSATKESYDCVRPLGAQRQPSGLAPATVSSCVDS
jgi:hypothetical protein